MSTTKKSSAGIKYRTRILKFGKKGEKSGWTYIEVPADVADKLNPGNKKSFRVKGYLDDFAIQEAALLPMGDGNFILPLNSTIRKGIGKRQGAMLQVILQIDKKELTLNADLIQCLEDEPGAKTFFFTLPKSHQNYFSKWIDSAKTPDTKAKRIAQAVNALFKKMGYAEMIRAGKRV